VSDESRRHQLSILWAGDARAGRLALRVDLQVSTLVARGDLMGWIHSFGRSKGTTLRGQLRGHDAGSSSTAALNITT
jgi:hypothetical protein